MNERKIFFASLDTLVLSILYFLANLLPTMKPHVQSFIDTIGAIRLCFKYIPLFCNCSFPPQYNEQIAEWPLPVDLCSHVLRYIPILLIAFRKTPEKLDV